MNTPLPKSIIVQIVYVLYVQEKFLVHRKCLASWYQSGLWVLEKWSKFLKNIIISFQFVICGRMMFIKIIHHIVDTFILLDEELVSSGTISQPIILHIPTFWLFHSHLRMNEAIGRRIISDNFRFFLQMSHNHECISDANCCTTVMKHSATFSFCCGWNYIFYCFTLNK